MLDKNRPGPTSHCFLSGPELGLGSKTIQARSSSNEKLPMSIKSFFAAELKARVAENFEARDSGVDTEVISLFPELEWAHARARKPGPESPGPKRKGELSQLKSTTTQPITILKPASSTRASITLTGLSISISPGLL